MGDCIDIVSDVIKFHEAIGTEAGPPSPTVPTKKVEDLKMRLVTEEYLELIDAIRHKSVTGVADSCADLIYVTVGLALAFGIDLRPVWREVHRANLAKAGGPKRSDGKAMKPHGWQPPDIAGVLAKQMGLIRD